MLQTAGCCAVGPGLAPDSRALPPQLAALGVRESDWFDLVELLDKDVQPKRWTDCLGWAVGSTLVGIPWLCSACAAYQSAARKWLDRLNANVLEPRGLFAKFQTNTFTVYGQNGQVGPMEKLHRTAVAGRWHRGCLEQQKAGFVQS